MLDLKDMGLSGQQICHTINPNMKLKFEILSAIKEELLSTLKSLFIFKINGNNVFLVTNKDQVYCFGNNKFAKLGLGHQDEVKEPVLVSELSGVELLTIEEGHQFMAGLTENGKVYIWGRAVNGQLGNGVKDGSIYAPILINTAINEPIVELKTNDFSTFMLTKSGDIYWFGYISSTGSKQLIPTKLTADRETVFVSITSGSESEHIIAKDWKGCIYGWGKNKLGQLGLGHKDAVNRLVKIVLNKENDIKVEKITVGWNHSLVLTAEGTVYAFGHNNIGQLGSGRTYECRQFPKPIVKYNRFVDVFAFVDTSLALCVEGFVYIWGQTSAGNVLRPQRTEFKSIQSAINANAYALFTYKPLIFSDLFENKSNLVMNAMFSAFNDIKYSDLTVSVDKKCIYVHKWFVANSCRHFDTMLSNEWSECEDNIIEIKEHSYEGYYAFLRCLYTDSIDTKDVKVLVDFLDITNEYSEEELKLKCIQTIKPLIDVKNVCSLYSASVKYNSNELKVFCFEFMVECMDNVVKSEDYQQMDSIYAKLFLTDYVNYINEINSQK